MDGTLLDLHFDNAFWLEQVPLHYAQKHQLSQKDALSRLITLMKRHEGELNWYCLDFWTRELDLDIMAIKEAFRDNIAIRPKTLSFLEAAKQHGKKLLLVTNAHRKSLDLKMRMTGLSVHFDALISSHDYGIPKEHLPFWKHLAHWHPFDPTRTVLFDDNEAVLNAAAKFGIRHLVCIHQPDSRQPARVMTRYPAIHHFDTLLPVLPSDPS
jgi:putative hydrolase of the HAD superfamily